MGATKNLYVEMQDQIMNDIYRAENGEQNHIDTFISMRKTKKRLEESIDLIKGYESDHFEEISSEMGEYPDGHKGFKFETRNGRTMWNFKNIEEWQTYDKAKKECESRYKAIFNAKMKGAVHANISEDGEELEMPSVSYGKGSLILKVSR